MVRTWNSLGQMKGSHIKHLGESKTILPPHPTKKSQCYCYTVILTCPLPDFGLCVDSVLVLHIGDGKGVRRWGSPPI